MMGEQQTEIKDILVDGLQYIDNAIAEDSNTKIFLWETVENVLTREHSNYESLADVIDRIFEAPAGRAIELVVGKDLDEVSQYLIQNKFFYVSLNQRFQYDYRTSIESFNNSPFNIVRCELMGANSNIIRIFRADKTYFDFNADPTGIAYIVEFMFNLTQTSFFKGDDDFKDEFYNYIKGRAESALANSDE
ncbi:hypothetical protein QNH38_08290 [Paenibacillus polymyxa]|uniref:hypothetical protein n=1 Tax=Paenibacillus polymyxa TaxID=1406 RepID=UPI0024BF4E77|nr:hypothetical protein [Paenibacillus polymyxa]WHX37431.1 hypothetical protein QNH38_08290 [Paenibacillus polymyxa]